jgi:hypothetical protein
MDFAEKADTHGFSLIRETDHVGGFQKNFSETDNRVSGFEFKLRMYYTTG